MYVRDKKLGSVADKVACIRRTLLMTDGAMNLVSEALSDSDLQGAKRNFGVALLKNKEVGAQIDRGLTEISALEREGALGFGQSKIQSKSSDGNKGWSEVDMVKAVLEDKANVRKVMETLRPKQAKNR